MSLKPGARLVAAICLLFLLCAALLSGCGESSTAAGQDLASRTIRTSLQQSTQASPEVTSGTTGGGTSLGSGQPETSKGEPFVLSLDQPVPPDFKAAYQRRSLILVEFYATSRDPFYPQGLGPDQQVSRYVKDLRGQYPTIQFFSYDISNPGSTSGGQLQPGQYGTLAAQLNVGYTPLVATMAPSGSGYVILNRLQGYTPEPVLSQALFDLSSIQVSDNSSDTNVTLGRVRLTGSGVDYFTVSNESKDPVNLQGFSLRVMDAKTGEVTTDSPGVTVEDSVRLAPGQSVSIGRVPDLKDAEGRPVAGTFGGGEKLNLKAGDQVALLDSGGAVADTTSAR